MRHCYIVCYDIADEKRLTQVRETVKDYGARLQFSVYQCEVADTDLARLKETLRGIINRDEDRILFLNLGPLEKSGQLSSCVESMGREPSILDTKKLVF